MNIGHLVQVPDDLGVLIPEIDSITELLPVDCSPDNVSTESQVSLVVKLAKHDTLGEWNILLFQT